ncbi:MAG: DUF4149 domain-containing protein [Bdellovibrio sp.]|nr:DUF4149 domain-containing protein [Methylotenera sp.]
MLSMYLLAGVIGVVLFFTVAVAPTIFKVLPQEWAGTYVRSFFPKYYAILGITCLLAAVLSQYIPIKITASNCSVLFAVSLWVLTPAINTAKDSNNTSRFNLLHGASVAINMIILAMLGYCFWT